MTAPNRPRSPRAGLDPPGIPWEVWRAGALNRLFRDQGVTGQLARITPKTVADAEKRASADEGPQRYEQRIDPATGIRPIADWGAGRGGRQSREKEEL